MREELDDLKIKVDKHCDDINVLKSDMRVTNVTVSDLVTKVGSLGSELHQLNYTIRDATVTMKTVITIVKVFIGVITLAGSILGVYTALHAM